jgi:hypothetical protein
LLKFGRKQGAWNAILAETPTDALVNGISQISGEINNIKVGQFISCTPSTRADTAYPQYPGGRGRN